MSSLKTEHYQLHKWEKDDAVLRAEFNENFGGIDSVLAGKAEVAAGTYTGDGAAERVIEVGFQPKAVLVMSFDGKTNMEYRQYGGLAVEGFPVRYNSSGYAPPIVTVTETGFKVYYTQIDNSRHVSTNEKNMVHHYLAVR